MAALGLYRVLRLSGDDVGEASEEAGVLSVPVSCRCGCQRVPLHEHRERLWQAAPLGMKRVFVTRWVPRGKCLSCGSKTWPPPPFAEGPLQITQGLEETVEFWLSRRTWSRRSAARGTRSARSTCGG